MLEISSVRLFWEERDKSRSYLHWYWHVSLYAWHRDGTGRTRPPSLIQSPHMTHFLLNHLYFSLKFFCTSCFVQSDIIYIAFHYSTRDQNTFLGYIFKCHLNVIYHCFFSSSFPWYIIHNSASSYSTSTYIFILPPAETWVDLNRREQGLFRDQLPWLLLKPILSSF